MNVFRKWLEGSPALARVIPFAVFIGLSSFQGEFGEASRYWFYLVKTLAGVWLLWMMAPLVSEMKWKFSLPAVLVGVGVFIMWVGLDDFIRGLGFKNSYPQLNTLMSSLGWGHSSPQPGSVVTGWNPHVQFGVNSALAWFFIVIRIVGSSLVVPPLEEVFYRSFLYRYIVKPDFQTVSFRLFAWTPFLFSAVLFGSTHNEWLAAILCAFAYQGLVCWKQRLGDAITAHAITNFLLGLWVVWRAAWHFW